MSVDIRLASQEDAPALLAIYAPYVQETAVTFEYDVPTLKDFTQRIKKTLEKYPYLVAENNGDIVGYAYAGQFKARAAYDWSVETSIYVRRDCHRMGIGRTLYSALERALSAQGILNMNASIASCGRKDDENLTRDSLIFHEKMGFTVAGEIHSCGFKFKKWYNMTWMEKHIGNHNSDCTKIIAFPKLLQK